MSTPEKETGFNSEDPSGSIRNQKNLNLLAEVKYPKDLELAGSYDYKSGILIFVHHEVIVLIFYNQVFILSPRGDSIISKDFRGDANPSMYEAFFRKVSSSHYILPH